MTIKELNTIIKKLELDTDIQEADLEILTSTDNEVDHYIKANIDGLQYFAIQLLKARLAFERVSSSKGVKIYPIPDNLVAPSTDIDLTHIMLSDGEVLPEEEEDDDDEVIEIKPHRAFIWGKIFGLFLFIVVILLIIISIPVGLYNLAKWIF